MSKSKTFREKDNERVHGKISYRKRMIEENEAEQEIIQFAPGFGMPSLKPEGGKYYDDTYEEYMKEQSKVE